jgi:DNA-binding beta-propeller fold protein YncE
MLEEINRVQEAIKLYNQVVRQAKDQRALAASAQYRVGLLYERLGRKAEALQAYKVVASQYLDQIDVAKRAKARIVATGANGKAISLAIKRDGPSPDGLYLATLNFPAIQGLNLSPPAIDQVKHRLYFVIQQINETSSDQSHNSTQQSRSRQRYEPSTLVVLDTITNSVVKTVPFSVYLSTIAFNPANNRLYAVAQVNGHVKSIDVNSFGETKIPIPGYPTHIAVNPATNKIYVNSQGFGGNDKLFVIDGTTNAVEGPFDLDGVAINVVVNSATNRIYASVDNRIKVRVFDGADNSVLTDLPEIYTIEADPTHNRIYACAVDSNHNTTLQVLDGNSNNLIAGITFASVTATTAAINPDINRLYVGLPEKSQIAVIDTETCTELGRLLVAKNPTCQIVDRTTGNLYVYHHLPYSIGLLKNDALVEEIPEEFFDSFDSQTLDPAWKVLKGQGS